MGIAPWEPFHRVGPPDLKRPPVGGPHSPLHGLSGGLVRNRRLRRPGRIGVPPYLETTSVAMGSRRPQREEVGCCVLTEHDGLAVEHQARHGKVGDGLDNAREGTVPVPAGPRRQLDVRSVLAGDDAIAVPLEFVNRRLVRPRDRPRPASREEGNSAAERASEPGVTVQRRAICLLSRLFLKLRHPAFITERVRCGFRRRCG